MEHLKYPYNRLSIPILFSYFPHRSKYSFPPISQEQTPLNALNTSSVKFLKPPQVVVAYESFL